MTFISRNLQTKTEPSDTATSQTIQQSTSSDGMPQLPALPSMCEEISDDAECTVDQPDVQPPPAKLQKTDVYASK